VTRHNASVLFVCVFFILTFGPSHILAGLIVNEVLANEPDSTQTLEWFELYNDQIQATNVKLYNIRVGAQTLTLDTIQGLTLLPRMYAVVCRDTAAVKARWPEMAEWTNTRFYQESFALPNTIDSVSLFFGATLISTLKWNAAGIDGYSWERVNPALAVVSQSIDRIGSTPGFINSLTLVVDDLAVISVQVTPDTGAARVAVTIANKSPQQVTGGSLRLFFADSLIPSFEGAEIISVPLPPVDPGFNTLASQTIMVNGIHQYIGASVNSDPRNRNNRMDAVVTGNLFPPLQLNEFLANPTGALFSEWVELKSLLSNDSVDLAGWQLGDALDLRVLSPTSIVIPPGEYVVACQNLSNMLVFYPNIPSQTIEPPSWPSLNEASDIVRLVDPYGFEVYRFTYTNSWDDNATWSRGETLGRENDWGRSEPNGGTPGEMNVVLFTADSSNELSIKLEPRIFTPDGDGVYDMLTITINPPEASSYSLKIYDRQGRIVRTLLDNDADFRGQYEWDGTNENGRRQPIGIYIIYFEAEGVESIKQTAVIAR